MTIWSWTISRGQNVKKAFVSTTPRYKANRWISFTYTTEQINIIKLNTAIVLFQLFVSFTTIIPAKVLSTFFWGTQYIIISTSEARVMSFRLNSLLLPDAVNLVE